MPEKISQLSTEFVRALVEVKESGALIDPTGFPVEMAFVDTATAELPQEADWNAAAWETAPDPQVVDGEQYWARCLVGPDGGKVLPVGRYSVWIRVDAEPEKPVKEVDELRVY